MHRKALLTILFLVLAFFIGGLTGLAAAYFVTGDGTKAIAETPGGSAQVKPATDLKENESGPSSPVEEPSSINTGKENDPASSVDHIVSHPDPGTGIVVETDPESDEEGEKKVAYLTIDDGPDLENTPAILEVLRDYGIKATFFVIGTQVEKHPELLEKIFEDGHAIGNHTYNHVYKDIYASDQTFLESIRKNEEIISNIIGECPVIIREPGGRFKTKEKKQEMLREAGYLRADWNIDSYDSRHPIPDAKTILANVKRQAAKKKLWPAMVILFHESGGHQTTVEALPLVIDFLLEEGFELKSLPEMDPDILANLPKP